VIGRLSETEADDLRPGEDPLVSVVILTYNHERYISTCLKSVSAIDYDNFEVVLLDDGSTDQTFAIACEFEPAFGVATRFMTQSNTGRIAQNAQRLIASANGEYTLFLSGDDALVSDYPLRSMIAAMRQDEHLALAIPRAVHVFEGACDSAVSIYTPEFRALLLTGDPERVFREHLCRSVSRLFLQGVVARRQFHESFGGFDHDKLADDYGFMMRAFRTMIETGQRFKFFEDALWIYRVHPANVHADEARQRRLVFEVVREYVPQVYWPTFRWDHREPDDLEGFVNLCEELSTYFGNIGANSLTISAERRFYFKCISRKDGRSLIGGVCVSQHRLKSLIFIFPRLYRFLPAIF